MFFAKLGVVGIPLVLCSIVALAVIVERLVIFIKLQAPAKRLMEMGEDLCLIKQVDEVEKLLLRHAPTDEACRLLLSHKDQPKNIRDEVLQHWLFQHQRVVYKHIRWLGLLATVAPMLGLLGTITGLIHSFQDLATVTGPVSPSLIADGLWEAMLTTAFGLAVAVPCLIALHGFRIWGGHHLEELTEALNTWSFALEGVAYGPQKKGLEPNVCPIPRKGKNI